IEVEWRGLEKIPAGALIVAAKHQSIWETFALIPLFADPTFIVKRELMWIPVFGWCMRRADMISVDRGAGSQALFAMTERAKFEIGRGRQIIIFPEGTRRATGAAPAYKFGVAKLYAATGATCLPIALNSGLVWPRRSFLRYPGVVRVEILDPIPPGLPADAFVARIKRSEVRSVGWDNINRLFRPKFDLASDSQLTTLRRAPRARRAGARPAGAGRGREIRAPPVLSRSRARSRGWRPSGRDPG